MIPQYLADYELQTQASVSKNKVSAQEAALAEARNPQEAPTEGAPKESSPSVVGDIAQGIGHGVTESVRSLYGLVDFVGNDWLPDWKQPLISKPETAAGSIIGSIAQFAIPYAGLGAALKGASVLANATSKTGRTVAWLRGVKAGKGTKEILAAHAKGDSVLAASRAAVLGHAVARETVKGGIVDFLAFENTGERLSDTIQNYPQLQNPITEFLAGDPDDNEAVGRLKNVLEGAALGSILDGVVGFAKGLKAGAKVQALGGSQNDIRAAQIAAVDDSAEAVKAKTRLIEDAQLNAAADQVNKLRKADGSVEEVTGAEVNKRLNAEVAKLADELSEGDPLNREAVLRSSGVTEADEGNLADAVKGLNSDLGTEQGLRSKPRETGAEELKLQGRRKTDANLSQYLETPDGGLQLRRIAEDLDLTSKPFTVTEKADAAGVLKDLKRVGNFTSDEYKVAMLALGEGAGDVRRVVRLGRIYNALSLQIGEELSPVIKEFAERADVGLEESLTAAHKFKAFLEMQNGARNIFSELGRGLRLGTMPLDPKKVDQAVDGLNFKPLDVMLTMNEDNFDPKQINAIFKRMSEVVNNPDGVSNLRAIQELLDAPWHQKALKVGLEYHVNALLSGVGTQVVNVVSAINMSFFRPLERLLLGSAIEGTEALLTGNKDLARQTRRIAREEWGTVQGLLSNFTQSFQMMRQSGGAFGSNSLLEGQTLSTIRTLGQDTDYEGLFDTVAKAINIPSQALVKGDAFIKTWNGMARATALLRSQLVEEGVVDAAEIEPLVLERLQVILKSKGKLRHDLALKKALNEAGVEGIPKELQPARAAELLDYDDETLQHLIDVEESAKLSGQEATLTTEVRPGVFGAAAQGVHTVSQRVPALKFMIPFVNTPVNIADAAWDRTFGGALGAFGASMNALGSKLGLPMKNTEKSLFRLQRMLSSSDPRVRQQAKANMVWGVGTVGAITALTSVDEGDPRLPGLTGSGPTSPEVRKTLEAAGWQPFSIKIGDRYVSYSRLDPFASILGIAADASEYLKEHNDEEGGLAFQSVLVGLTASVANNITSKTYAQGMANTLDLVMDPDRNGERVLGSLAGSFIPTIVANTEKVVDPDLQEIRSITDRLLSRIPGLSSSLAPRRDLLGDVITNPNAGTEFFLPIRVSQVKDNVVAKELSRYAYGFSQPLTTKSGVDLLDDKYRVRGQEAYDRYLELSGSHKLRGKDLRQALKVLIKSPEYLKLDAGEGPNGEKSPRINLINSVIRKHRAAAWNQLLREVPSLRSAVDKAERDRANRREGRGGLTL